MSLKVNEFNKDLTARLATTKHTVRTHYPRTEFTGYGELVVRNAHSRLFFGQPQAAPDQPVLMVTLAVVVDLAVPYYIKVHGLLT